MFRFFFKIIIIIAANALGIWAAAKYISGFRFDGNFTQLLTAAFILAVLNWILKPVLKLVLGPVIFLTLGLGLIVVNALVLYVLDIFSKSLTIETIPALLYGTILIGLINFIAHLIT